MINKRFILIPLLALFTIAITNTGANAATKAELQTKFEKRYPQILNFKKDGKVGETTTGIIEAVKSDYLTDKTLAKLIEDENADRKELYKLIAEEEKTTADQVARAAAIRNFQKAKAGEYLKAADGTWKKKP